MTPYALEQEASHAVSPAPRSSGERVIVCGVSDSPGAPSVTGCAARLADDLGAGLVLVHVADPAAGGIKTAFMLERLRRIALVEAMALLDSVKQETERGTIARAEIGSSPARRLIEAAKRREAAFIVIGAGRRPRPVSAVLTGVRERVIGEAPCPVIVVPH